jgi:hypothetical protein
LSKKEKADMAFFRDLRTMGISWALGIVMSGWRPLIKGYFAVAR